MHHEINEANNRSKLTFLVSSLVVFRLFQSSIVGKTKRENTTYPHQLHKGIIDTSAMRKEKAAPWAKIVEEEQFLILLLSSR
jgi:hypothetical protein